MMFCTQELSLEALVIGYDDLMRRVQDQAKDKLVPFHLHFGGKVRLPRSSELVSQVGGGLP